MQSCPTLHVLHPCGTTGRYREDLLRPRSGKDNMFPTTCPEITTGMMADKYTAKFKILTGRTSFNDVVLEDAFIWGLPHPILFKVYSHTSLLSGMDNWKTIICTMDCLHQGFTELKQSICPTQMQRPRCRPQPSPTLWPPLMCLPETSEAKDLFGQFCQRGY